MFGTPKLIKEVFQLHSFGFASAKVAWKLQELKHSFYFLCFCTILLFKVHQFHLLFHPIVFGIDLATLLTSIVSKCNPSTINKK